jgi:quercetin dioxygenase-like cupin family protein
MVRNVSMTAFTLGERQGRTPPFNILGIDTLVKLANADTDGAVLIFHHVVPSLAGTPVHRHSNEDEWFYVLEGEITVEIDGDRRALQKGSSAFAPRGTAHAYKNFQSPPSQMLTLVTPARLQSFFEDLSSLGNGQATPDQTRVEALAEEYGIEILGPPLS